MVDRLLRFMTASLSCHSRNKTSSGLTDAEVYTLESGSGPIMKAMSGTSRCDARAGAHRHRETLRNSDAGRSVPLEICRGHSSFARRRLLCCLQVSVGSNPLATRRTSEGDICGCVRCEAWAWVMLGHPDPCLTHPDLTWGKADETDGTPPMPWGAACSMCGFDRKLLPSPATIILHRSVVLMWDNKAAAKRWTWADHEDDVSALPGARALRLTSVDLDGIVLRHRAALTVERLQPSEVVFNRFYPRLGRAPRSGNSGLEVP